MPVVGHGNVDDHDHILPPGADKEALDHHIIVLLVPAQDELRHPFQADMVRIHLPDTAVRQRPGTNPLEPHGYLTTLPAGWGMGKTSVSGSKVGVIARMGPPAGPPTRVPSGRVPPM